MAGRFLTRLLAPWRSPSAPATVPPPAPAVSVSPAPQAKIYASTGIRFVGGSGPLTNAGLHWLDGRGGDPEALGRMTAFAVSAYCYVAMMWRATRVAEPPLMVVRETEDGEEWEPAHPLSLLFDEPRPDLDMGELLQQTVLYRDWSGGCLWVLDRDRAGRVAQITPFSQEEFRTHRVGALIFGRYEIYNAEKKWVPVLTENVVHFRDPSPFGWRACTSKVDAALLQLNLSHTVNRITRNFLQRAMFPGGVLSPDPDWKPEPGEWEEWKQTISEWHSGPANAGEPLALQGGTVFSRAQSALKDLLPADVLDRVEATVGSVFGIPPVVLGWLSGMQNSPWSQMSEARRQTYEDTIEPLWRDICNRAGRKLLAPEERAAGLLVRFDTSQVRALQEDQEGKARISASNATTWTRNERRVFTGQDPLDPADPRGEEIEGTLASMPPDDLGTGDPAAAAAGAASDIQATALNGAQVTALVDIVARVTSGDIPLSSAAAMVRASFPLLTEAQVDAIFADVEEGSAPPAPNPFAGGGGQREPDDDEDEDTPAKRDIHRVLRELGLLDAQPESGQKRADTTDLLWWIFDVSTKASEPRWAVAIHAHLQALRGKILAAARKEFKAADGTTEEHKLAHAALVQRIAAGLPGAEAKADIPGWVEDVISADKPILVAKTRSLVLGTGTAAVRRVGARLKISFRRLEPGLLQYAEREAAFLADVMGETTGAAVAKAVQAGLAAGDTISGLVARLQDLPAFSGTRAKMVARTETTRAWNGAQRSSLSHYAKATGTKVLKFWLSARDSRVRDEHAALDDDKGIPVDDTFDNGLSEPGEPNCRCSLTYEVVPAESDEPVDVDEPSAVTA